MNLELFNSGTCFPRLCENPRNLDLIDDLFCEVRLRTLELKLFQHDRKGVLHFLDLELAEFGGSGCR
ncbi:MAG TPA: hypothetical protein VGA56_19885 [Opitutaceae bacterium]